MLKIRQSVAVFKAVVSVLDGALTVAEVVIGFRDISEDPGVLGRQRECSIRVGESFFAELVFRIEHAEHGLGSLVSRIDRNVSPEKSENFLARTKHVLVVLEPGISELEIGPNAPVAVVEFDSLAGGCD